MRRILVLISALILAFISLTPAAFASTSVTVNSTALTIGDTLTLTTDGPAVITGGGWYNVLSSPLCAVRQYGSYSSGGQKTEYTCSAATVLTGKTNNAGTQTFVTDAGQHLSVSIAALPVVTPPPPPPAAHYVYTQTTCSAPGYVVTIKNDGNADGVMTYTDTYCTPNALTDITAPAGTTVTFRTVCNRFHACYKGNGFVVKNIAIAAGQTVTITEAK